MTIEEIEQELQQIGMLMLNLAERADAEFLVMVYKDGKNCVVANVPPERCDELMRASFAAEVENYGTTDVPIGGDPS